jgi:signal transduction histidine kinase
VSIKSLEQNLQDRIKILEDELTKTKAQNILLLQERELTNERMIEQQEKLLTTSRSAAMGEMISMIAHQWRQPLSVINTVMATLHIKHELGTLEIHNMKDSFKKIEETVNYLSNTIDDFKDYFKPNKVLEEISLLEIIKKSTIFLTSDIEFLNITYKHNISKTLTLTTYKNELIQCIINIFKNSIDAFKENNVENKLISLRVKEEKEYLSLLFSDNAGGIDSHIINKVFEPYFSTKAKNGTGLGLYMTKTIIEKHLHGKITITSEEGNTFTLIELPYKLQNKEI